MPRVGGLLITRAVMRQFMDFAKRCQHRHDCHSQDEQAQHEHAQDEREAMAGMDHGRRA